MKHRGSISSLLLAAFLLLFLCLLLPDYTSRNAQAVVFLEIVVLVHISSYEKLRVRLLEFIQERIIHDRDLVYVDIGQLGTL